ncbi:MAG: hypothetical protein H6737_00400 [Alphaproteobacteria bacterium]|nr:hypothetical protein [Alphaproteobacteria bacterium]
MRAWLTLFLVGCNAGGAITNPPDTDGTVDCTTNAGPEYVEASGATLSFNNLLVNQATVGTDVTTIAACVRADGTGAAWFINDSSGNPYLTILNETDQTGGIAMTDGTFVVDIYGNDPPITFSGSDFFTNQWVVNSLSPFSTSFTGSAVNSGSHQLELSFFATATP